MKKGDKKGTHTLTFEIIFSSEPVGLPITIWSKLKTLTKGFRQDAKQFLFKIIRKVKKKL